jgi:uncharacterized protein (DUF983 family)
MTSLATELKNAPTVRQSRSVWTAMRRGFGQTCPHCGRGAMFTSYLKVAHDCPACGEPLYHQRADDAPPYVTIAIVGHVLIGLYLLAEDYGPALPALAEVVIFSIIGLLMCLWLLPRVKGALIGLQWALRMHGFGGPSEGAPGSLA